MARWSGAPGLGVAFATHIYRPFRSWLERRRPLDGGEREYVSQQSGTPKTGGRAGQLAEGPYFKRIQGAAALASSSKVGRVGSSCSQHRREPTLDG